MTGDEPKCGCRIDGLNEVAGVMVSTKLIGEVVADELPVAPTIADAMSTLSLPPLPLHVLVRGLATTDVDAAAAAAADCAAVEARDVAVVTTPR